MMFRRHRKGTLAFAATTALLVAMGASNPNTAEHEKSITAALTKIANAGDEDGLFGQKEQAINISHPVAQQQTQIVTDALQNVSSKFIETSVKTAVNVTNFLFCSVGEIKLNEAGLDSLDNGGDILSIGILGHVITIDKNNISNILNYI